MAETAKTGAGQPAFDPIDPKTFLSMASLGGEAMERTMRMAADAAVRTCRSAAAAGAAQLEIAQAMRDRIGVGGSGGASALSASSEAAIAGVEACMEKAVEYTRATADGNVEVFGRALAARTPDEWFGVQIEAAARTMNLGVSQAAELGRIAAETSTRCLDPFKGRGESAEEAA